jgi:hypothetical protein
MRKKLRHLSLSGKRTIPVTFSTPGLPQRGDRGLASPFRGDTAVAREVRSRQRLILALRRPLPLAP